MEKKSKKPLKNNSFYEEEESQEKQLQTIQTPITAKEQGFMSSPSARLNDFVQQSFSANLVSYIEQDNSGNLIASNGKVTFNYNKKGPIKR